MSSDKGFSLVETLVALAVFSTAALGMVALNTNTARLSADMDQRFMAGLVAEAVMAETLTDPDRLIIGLQSGQMRQRHQSFHWTRTISPTDRQSLLIVEVNVAAEGADDGLARLTVLAQAPS